MTINSDTLNSKTLNGIKKADAFLPELEDSESQPVGSWNVTRLNFGDEQGTFGLIELRAALEVEIPSQEFSLSDYPNADLDNTIGKPKPIGFGTIKGAKGFLTDTGTNEFTLFGHSVYAMTAFYDADGQGFTPDSFSPSNATFTYAAWDGEKQLYADVIVDDNDSANFETDNPVDVVRLLLTDEDRGANLSVNEINTETTPAGQGFGSTGARVKYVLGTDSVSGKESYTYPVSLYVTDRTKVTELIDQIKAFCFGFIYVMTADTADNPGVWNFRAQEPIQGSGLLEVTENNIIGKLKVTSDTRDPITSAIGRYAINSALESERSETYQNDRLRQKRGLPLDSVLDVTLPTTDRSAALRWAENQVEQRGRVRRTFSWVGTNELKLIQPGDSVKLDYSPTDIDEVVTILEVTQVPGAINVTIKAIDVFGFRDEPGFWTDSSTAWDDTWSDSEVDSEKEDNGFWADDDGYADVTDDPLRSYYPSVWS